MLRFVGRHRCLASTAKFGQIKNIILNYRALSQSENLYGEAIVKKEHEFQAETRKLLDIVAKSLYSDKEVFIRELISNASDALNKRKFEQLKAGEEPPILEINLTCSKSNNSLIFFDNGIGMSELEAIDHLGTIAKSGSKEFMSEVEKNDSASAQSIIGQFGVGFYSVFMVADKVDVYTRRWDAPNGIHWSSDGQGGYTVEEVDGLSVGTQIELHLKTDCREYSDVDEVRKVAAKYSSFTQFPLLLDNEQVNNMEPIWMLDKNKITDEMHNDFYKFLCSNDPQNDGFSFQLNYKTEMPIAIRSIFYIPKKRPPMSSENTKSEIALYCRKVLISNNTDMLLPSWMRFMKGVVDSEDIPLNLSRELLQNTALINRIRETLTDRLIKFLNDRAKREPEKYNEFYHEFKVFMAEGVAREQNSVRREEISKLLRYESTELAPGEYRSLDDYIKNMKDDQRYIFYLPVRNRAQGEASPYLEAVKSKGYEVLFMYDVYDEVVAENLQHFKEKTLLSIENDIIDDNIDIKSMDQELKDESNDEEFTALADWSKTVLGNLVKEVTMTSKLEKQPAMVTVWGLGATRQFLKFQQMENKMTQEQLAEVVQPKLQLSKKHPVTNRLITMRSSHPEIAESLLRMIYETAMANAGLNEDAASIANRTNELVEVLLSEIK